KMLRESTAGDKERGAAVDVFERAYRRLSDQLRGRDEKGNLLPMWSAQPVVTGWSAAPVVAEVREVFADGLVTLSVSDAGVSRGQTLAVQRLEPAPAYLGLIQIVDVKDTLAVGKVKLQPGASIRPRDRVTFKEQGK